MGNIINLKITKKFPKEAELYNKLCDLIEDYNGELSLVSVMGILHLKLQNLTEEQSES